MTTLSAARLNRPEAILQAKVLADIGTLPDLFVWVHATGTARDRQNPARIIHFGLPGSPDIIGVHNGRAVGIEMKRPDGGVQSDQQKKFQQRWERCGGLYVLARSIDEVREGLGINE
jgi:hypothetical protein